MEFAILRQDHPLRGAMRPGHGCLLPENRAVVRLCPAPKAAWSERRRVYGKGFIVPGGTGANSAEANGAGTGQAALVQAGAAQALLSPADAPRHDTAARRSAEVAPGSEGLVALAQAGDVRAIETLLSHYYPFMIRVACRWLGHRADAEDVTQSVCMRLADTIRSFDGRASFQSWLYRVTLNAVRDHQRASTRRGRLVAAATILTEEIRQGDQEDALHVADIWRAVRALPEKQRDSILLVHGEGLTQAEAARIMGCREVTVSWHIHQARKALRGVL